MSTLMLNPGGRVPVARGSKVDPKALHKPYRRHNPPRNAGDMSVREGFIHVGISVANIVAISEGMAAIQDAAVKKMKEKAETAEKAKNAENWGEVIGISSGAAFTFFESWAAKKYLPESYYRSLMYSGATSVGLKGVKWILQYVKSKMKKEEETTETKTSEEAQKTIDEAKKAVSEALVKVATEVEPWQDSKGAIDYDKLFGGVSDFVTDRNLRRQGVGNLLTREAIVKAKQKRMAGMGNAGKLPWQKDVARLPWNN